MKKKTNKLFILISLLVITIVTLILLFTKLDWYFYLFGVLVGFTSHGIMLFESESRYKNMTNSDLKEIYHPKKSAILWSLLKLLVTGSMLGLIFLFSVLLGYEVTLATVIILLAGYLTVKIIFIICLIIFEKE